MALKFLAAMATLCQAIEFIHAPKVLQTADKTFASQIDNYRDSVYTGSMKFGTNQSNKQDKQSYFIFDTTVVSTAVAGTPCENCS